MTRDIYLFAFSYHKHLIKMVWRDRESHYQAEPKYAQVSAWEKFVAWSYKPPKIGVYNGSAILTLSVVALLLCYNISSPSICEIVICPTAGNWGDDETQGYALNYLNLSVLGFYWHIKREGEQGVRGWCQTAECLRHAWEKGKQGTRWLYISHQIIFLYLNIFFFFCSKHGTKSFMIFEGFIYNICFSA